jgi:adhesin transport system outer membrane protein
MAALLVALSEVGATYETVTTLSLFTTLERLRVMVDPLMLRFEIVTGLPSTLTVNAVVAAPPKTPDVQAREESLAAFVKDWAAGWSTGNAERYLSFYSERFVPETKTNFTTWADQRRQRITPEQGIQVQIEDTQVISSSPQLAELSFKQFYVSKSLKARSTKQLTLEQHNGQWAIVRERVIPK